MTCGKTQEFLASHKVGADEQIDARKKTYKDKEALALAADADELYAAKGKKVVHIDLKKERPDDETLLSLMLGPTGNLRAPTLRKGRTLIIGFDEDTYKKLLK
jgi:arsenate reductase-like glutaredoxin family protein